MTAGLGSAACSLAVRCRCCVGCPVEGGGPGGSRLTARAAARSWSRSSSWRRRSRSAVQGG
jgi:hypothetical protein